MNLGWYCCITDRAARRRVVAFCKNVIGVANKSNRSLSIRRIRNITLMRAIPQNVRDTEDRLNFEFGPCLLFHHIPVRPANPLSAFLIVSNGTLNIVAAASAADPFRLWFNLLPRHGCLCSCQCLGLAIWHKLLKILNHRRLLNLIHIHDSTATCRLCKTA